MMDNTIVKQSLIQINVGLDSQNNPQHITWSATDSGMEENREVKAFILSLWDKKENNSMRLELWNKEMMVDEMKTFIYQSIISMSDLLNRSTGESELSEDMKDFAAYFAKKADLLK
ncbi:MAG: gliding motility protein GldC [Candidatus Competibacteraceae bacterium]|nr:gliding motility protein GldC [Candidatus Competibacteraceae bacterium]